MDWRWFSTNQNGGFEAWKVHEDLDFSETMGSSQPPAEVGWESWWPLCRRESLPPGMRERWAGWAGGFGCPYSPFGANGVFQPHHIYIYHEWTGIISPRHGKANDAWGEVPPKSIDFRLANEYNAARLHSTMWILISPTCGYGPAIQYPMISLLVVPFGPSNLSISSPWEAGGCEWTVVWEDMGMPLYLATLLVDCHNPGTPCYYNWSSFSLKPIHSYLFGGVPEIWVPQTMVFLIDNNHFGMFWGTHISGNPSINKPSINHP